MTLQTTEELSSTELPEVQEPPPLDGAMSESDSEEGSVAVAAILAALGVLCIASALAYFIYRYFRKRSVHSMNFDNPVYKKTTTEDGFHLAGQRNQCSRGSTGGPQYQHRQYGVTSPEDGLCEPMVNTLKF